MYDDDEDDFWEPDREVMHESARLDGTTPSGEPLPRTTDKLGRVWVTCTCGSKSLLKGRPETADTHERLDPDIAAAIAEAIGDEDW